MQLFQVPRSFFLSDVQNTAMFFPPICFIITAFTHLHLKRSLEMQWLFFTVLFISNRPFLQGKADFMLDLIFIVVFCSQGQQEQEKRESDLQELMGKLASVQAEKKSLLMEKNGLVAENKTLEAALETAQKEKRFGSASMTFP